jgi:hypothetical protein
MFDDSSDLEIVEAPSSLSNDQQTENDLKAKRSKKRTVYQLEKAFKTASEFNGDGMIKSILCNFELMVCTVIFDSSKFYSRVKIQTILGCKHLAISTFGPHDYGEK